MRFTALTAFTLASLCTTAGAATLVFSDNQPISIPASGTATPYPSSIEVPPGAYTPMAISVTISGLTHTYPGDLDILLVSPAGVGVFLMSDAGASFDVSGVTLAFQDNSPLLPESGQMLPGTYRPTNYGGGDGMPGSPTSTIATTLAGLLSNSIGGTWSLYVVDDATGDSGSIAGWSLSFTLDTPLVTYQGSLSDADGPVSRPVELRFSAWDNDTGGEQIGQTDTLPAITPSGGLFTVDLDLQASDLAGAWLQIDVRDPPGSGDWVPLAPRQPLNPAPNARIADFARALAFPVPWNQAGDVAFTSARVGIGTRSPVGQLGIGNYQGGTGVSAVAGYGKQAVISGDWNVGTNTGTSVKLLIADYDNDPNCDIYPIYVEDENNIVQFYLRGVAMNKTAYIAGSVGINETNPESALQITTPTALGAGGWQLRLKNAAAPSASQVGALRQGDGGLLEAISGVGNATAFARLSAFGSWSAVSDRRFKKDVAPLTGVLDRALALEPVSFRFTSESDESRPRQIGFIAQDVAPLFPSLVIGHGDEPRTLDYSGLSVVAIGAIQEQQRQIESLRTENEALKSQLRDLLERVDRLESPRPAVTPQPR